MLQVIIEAIRNRKILSFSYNGLFRVVEPHTVGLSRAGRPALSCYQIKGLHVKPGHEWDFCVLSNIHDLKLTGEVFLNPRYGYKRGDSRMLTIYAEL
jgi:hypothetical protein